MIDKKFFVPLMLALMFAPSTVGAEYTSHSDTDVEVFDYIENRRREARDKQLTPEQVKLLEDVETAKEQLPHPDLETEQVPAVFEGDNLVYHTETGEFIAQGKVDILQLEGRRFQTDKATGNVIEKTVSIQGRAHVLQVVDGSPRVTLDGYRTFYNYGTSIGTMGSARGKAGEYYITGKRFEFYPDHIVAFDATQTKCGAAQPDYTVSAEKMEIWPERVIKMYKIKFRIKGNVVGTKDYDERKFGGEERLDFPRIGYNKDYGAYIEQRIERPITDHFKSVTKAHLETKRGVRSNTEIVYDNRDSSARVVYGFYSDGDNVWVQKEPSLILHYGRHFDHLPASYGFNYEIGHWKSNSVSSTHQKYEVGLARDPIIYHNWMLTLGTSYTITKESSDDSTVHGINYGAVLLKEFDDRFAAFTGYHYTKNTKKNSLFDFENDDYAKKISMGLSWRMDHRNRFVVGLSFDADRSAVQDVDYYWYHDLHCSQVILRWRDRRDKLEAHWQFTPW
ncbi:MAG: LPS-assembly protein LptD [Selenomonadaceae bacterium]|nr:LPS-assembly protein LptD [Selenomonadaceae bacterium]